MLLPNGAHSRSLAAAASVSDTIFGSCLVYDLAALAGGQAGTSERYLLGGYAAIAAGIVNRLVC